MRSCSGADMGESRRDQLAIGENMADAFLKRVKSVGAFSAPSYLTVLNILSQRTVQGHSQNRPGRLALSD